MTNPPAPALAPLAYNAALRPRRSYAMQLRADFSESIDLDTGSLPWVPSPDGSVLRRMLDRIGGEVARATSIVRYPPGSRFPAHEHPLGEEFLVLDGVFTDEHGDYPAGAYVRNPPGSTHAPRSNEGCTIFVKLRQMPPDEDRHVRIEPARARWREWRRLRRLDLFEADYESVCLIENVDSPVRLEPAPVAGFEALVLSGQLDADGSGHGPGTWLRRPSTGGLALTLGPGCRIWMKTGHLSA